MTEQDTHIGPLQLSIHAVQNRHVGTQKLHWDKKHKGNCHLKLCMPFTGLAPVRLFRPNMAVLYHVNGKRPICVCYRFDFLANVLDLLFAMDYPL